MFEISILAVTNINIFDSRPNSILLAKWNHEQKSHIQTSIPHNTSEWYVTYQIFDETHLSVFVQYHILQRKESPSIHSYWYLVRWQQSLGWWFQQRCLVPKTTSQLKVLGKYFVHYQYSAIYVAFEWPFSSLRGVARTLTNISEGELYNNSYCWKPLTTVATFSILDILEVFILLLEAMNMGMGKKILCVTF